MTTGFEYKNNILQISKSPAAELAYFFDWVNWLDDGDNIASVSYTIQARANDPQPLTNQGHGVQGTKTFVSLSGGQVDKTYTVTATVETGNGLTDSRYFKVNVQHRSA
jgi:hypothetical protein